MRQQTQKTPQFTRFSTPNHEKGRGQSETGHLPRRSDERSESNPALRIEEPPNREFRFLLAELRTFQSRGAILHRGHFR
jgi:hypothetical protein